MAALKLDKIKDKGECSICGEEKDLVAHDKELIDDYLSGDVCAECLPFVKSADAFINSSERYAQGYCRPK